MVIKKPTKSLLSSVFISRIRNSGESSIVSGTVKTETSPELLKPSKTSSSPKPLPPLILKKLHYQIKYRIYYV
ncbi:hypothetical protein AALP_AAs44594U000200, partial [Arabis alpina]